MFKNKLEILQILLSQNSISSADSPYNNISGNEVLSSIESLMESDPDLSAFYNFIFEKSQQIYYYKAQDNITWLGPIERMLGYLPEENYFSSFENFADILHTEDKAEYLNFLNELKDQEKVYCKLYKIKHKSGHYLLVEDSGRTFKNADGQKITMGVLNDMSARHRVNAILKSRERNSKIIHDLSLIHFRELSLEDMLTSCLKVISDHSNWPVGRAISLYRGRFEDKVYNSLWYTSDEEKYGSMFNCSQTSESVVFSPLHLQIMETSIPFIHAPTSSIKEHESYNKADKLGLKSILLFPIHVKNQIAAIVEFYCSEADLNDSFFSGLIKQLSILLGNMLENKIIEDEFEKFLLAIEQNFASVVITNSKGYIVYTNPRFSEVSGYTREEALGKKPAIVKSGLHDKAFYKDIWCTISSGNRWQGEITNRRKDGSLYIEQVSVSPLKDKEGIVTHFVAVKFDISEKKKGEEELKKAKEIAELANKTKTEFLASMSHEIRTPMNAILGFAELLSSKITDEQQSSYLESIQSSGKSLLNLINDVLDLSKIEAGKMIANIEYFDPFHLFKDVEYMFALRAHDKGLDFKVEVDMNLPVSIESDEIRWRQILINLIGNAIKFTDSGYVKVIASCTNTYLVGNDNYIDMKIEISDSGIGISDEFKKVMFAPFTQQEGQDNKRYGGTGLGLTITKKIVQLLNAELLVESKPNHGSTFTLVFPKLRASTVIQNNIGISTITPDKIKFHSSRIIIADDVENNRNYIKAILENTGIEILESKNGLVTYELAKIYMPNAIITDIKMPGIDGFELLRMIKSSPELRHIPVVASTASTSVEDKNKIFQQNFDGILIKPIQVNDVYLELMRLLPHNIVDIDLEDIKIGIDTKQDKSISISAISDEHIHTVKRMLETDLYSIWKTFEQQQPLSEVEAFARKCRELGQKYELGILVSYGNRLLSAINNFDIDNMLKTIQEYPKLLNTFKTINED